jgi:integrase
MTMRKIKYLKIDQNSDWLAYQRGLPKDIRAKAKAMKVPLTIVRPLGLTKAASATEITAAIEKHNKVFDDVCRMLRSTSEGTAAKKQMMENAKVLLEIRGVEQGALVDIDPMQPAFDATLDAALGIHQNQDNPQWDLNYPDEERMPEDLVSAVNTLLNTNKGHEQVHLFSDAADHYKQHKQQELLLKVTSQGKAKTLKRAWDKDLKRLNDFMVFSGNQEFTSDNCNVALRLYRKHLLQLHKTSPASAKRDLVPAAAALRKYAEEVAINVAVTTKLTINEQRAKSKQRPVVDVEKELPLIWIAAHNDAYDHLFRLHAFGIFSGSTSSELIQTDVEEVFDDYFILRGTKRASRTRPVVIINETHRQLLKQFKDYPKDNFGFASICGKRAMQTEAIHSKVIKEQLFKATGNPVLTAYSMRHTGKHLGEIKGVSHLPTFQRMFGWSSGSDVEDDYGKAGIYSDAMLKEFRELTDKLIDGLPSPNSPTPAMQTTNVIQLKR